MTPKPASWRFARMSPSQVNQDPVQGEFFTAAADLPDRLVRESIQNSLGACLYVPSRGIGWFEETPNVQQHAFRLAQFALPYG